MRLLNKLKDVLIPGGVIHIGDQAFKNNHLYNISIPDSVTVIGAYAFADNQITKIKLGENVQMEAGAFDNCFVKFYQDNGKMAGLYVFENGNWEMKE